MNLKKILLGSCAVVLAFVSMVTPVANGASLNDPEFDAALAWAYENGLTMYNTVDAFNPYGTLTREQFAKFAASFGVTNLCLEVDETTHCNFSDIPADPSLEQYVMLACELGLVRGAGGNYYPIDPVTKAQVLTVMSRAMAAAAGESAPAEDMTPRWKGHFDAMVEAGITKETDPYAVDRSVTRYEALLMMYRARMDDAECGDIDINDLLDELFGDDTTTPTDDETTDVVTESNGTVKAMLSPSTPNGATVPGGVAVKVASFDFTATSEAVTIDEIVVDRRGLGDNGTVERLTLFANNEVVSKSKSYNSDKQAVFSLNPAVTVEPGKTVMIDVVARVGVAASNSNEEFAVGLVSFSSNGKEDMANLPVVGNTFRVGGVDGAEVVVDDDGNVSDVNLGDKGVEVAKFTVENNSSTNSDVELTQITMKDYYSKADDNLANFVLKHNGTVVATSAKTNGKYLTFVFSTPVVIGDGETEDFRVYADVVAGAGDTIGFYIDQEIYVLGTDSDYGYGIAVDVSNYVRQDFAIKAGELTLVEQKLPTDMFRQDRDDVVLAQFELLLNAGKDISLENIKFTLNGGATLSGDTWGAPFENAELRVVINGATKRYDLEEGSATTTAVVFSETDLGIFLKSTDDVVVKLVADTVKTFDTDWTDGDDKFSVQMLTSEAGGFKVIENQDDVVVTKIVPSSITFDNVTLVKSTVTVTKLNLGTSVDVVKGSKNVDAYKFQIKPAQAGNVYAQSFTFDADFVAGTGCTITNPNSELFSAVKLWKSSGASGSWELLEQQGGFDITTTGTFTFDNFPEVEVMASKTQQFLVTVDVTDDDATVGCSFDLNITAADIEDDQNKDLTVTVPGDIGRTVIVTAAGTLEFKVETNDSRANRAKHVLGGTTSEYVAVFDLVADNEGAVIEDLLLNVAGAGTGTFDAAVMEVIIYDDAGTEILRESVSSSTQVAFEDINWEIPEGTTTILVKVVADFIGSNANGAEMANVTLSLDADNVDGADSGDPITPTPSGQSYAFDVIPVHISNVEFVSSYGGYNVTTTYNSNTTDSVLAILKVTTNSWSNTELATNTILDAVLDTIQFTYPATVTNVTLERVDISNGAQEPAVTGLVQWGVDDINNTLTKGTIAYYVLEGDIATTAGTFTVKINSLDGGDFVYRSDDA